MLKYVIMLVITLVVSIANAKCVICDILDNNDKIYISKIKQDAILEIMKRTVSKECNAVVINNNPNVSLPFETFDEIDYTAITLFASSTFVNEFSKSPSKIGKQLIDPNSKLTNKNTLVSTGRETIIDSFRTLSEKMYWCNSDDVGEYIPILSPNKIAAIAQGMTDKELSSDDLYTIVIEIYSIYLESYYAMIYPAFTNNSIDENIE